MRLLAFVWSLSACMRPTIPSVNPSISGALIVTSRTGSPSQCPSFACRLICHPARVVAVKLCHLPPQCGSTTDSPPSRAAIQPSP
ncbi:hypothetical protein L226DRAFT_534141 [Lentinus tigrinus ALCF2SS1-7]|uniref:uncharacterized protein n=1 Tax=Lentinus tigrinus ALCF2SS1-7 TaxID=1328758 RepID=UPI0011662CD2|nr:hypothetical protein L226DRAFT_534141 [Lentinus tigrinus ALCF2SS1-7]